MKREMLDSQASQDHRDHPDQQDFPAKMDSLAFREQRVTREMPASLVFQAW